MDRQTVSHYGWIVVSSMIIVVILLLATPFGTYMVDSITSTAKGLIQTSDEALMEENKDAIVKEWEDAYLNDQDSDATTPTTPTEVTKTAGATFNDGSFLTWEELSSTSNGIRYGYNAEKLNQTTTNIPKDTFKNCNTIISIVMPEDVVVIEEYAFSNCQNLTTIMLSSKTMTIKAAAFDGCQKLSTVTIPSTVSTLERLSLGNCTSLKGIIYEGAKEGWGAILKDSEWDLGTSNYTIYCKDGNIKN